MTNPEPLDVRKRSDDRSDAREQALIALYEAEQRGVSLVEIMQDRPKSTEDLARVIALGVAQNAEAIDSLITAHSKGWALDRMPALDRAVLRMGVFELLHRSDTPIAVVIDEAVELAKRFSTDDSGRFVNGVLAAVARASRPTEK
ncbi:MAG: transcription antitermination factor NusB [Ilumatobacteraceae bacterium]|nr:transcription antitermination factor NusB [Ilumatobacteraceae bacterium]